MNFKEKIKEQVARSGKVEMRTHTKSDWKRIIIFLSGAVIVAAFLLSQIGAFINESNFLSFSKEFE